MCSVRGLSSSWLVMTWQGDASGMSIFRFQPDRGLRAYGQHPLPGCVYGGFSFYRTTQRHLVYIPRGGTSDSVLSLNHCLSYHYFSRLMALPLFLHSLTYLISNSSSLLLELRQGLFLYKEEMGNRGGFVYGEASQDPARFQAPLFSICLSPGGNRGWTRKGMRLWIERIIINLTGGAWF